MAERKTRDEVLALIREGRTRLDDKVARLTPAQLDTPGLAGGDWSPKDLLAHITFWEALMVHRLGGAMPEVEWAGDTDATNAANYARNRDRPLVDVRRDFDAIHRDLVARIERLSDDQLNSRRTPDEEWVLWEEIRGETWGHYPEHVEAIKAGPPRG